MRYAFLFSTIALFTTACSTMNDSLELGSGLGGAAGAAATYAGYSAGGKSPSFGTIAVGAGIGMSVGLLTSYLTHKKVAEDRTECQDTQTEMHFGDLPPSPFVIPKPTTKKRSIL